MLVAGVVGPDAYQVAKLDPGVGSAPGGTPVLVDLLAAGLGTLGAAAHVEEEQTDRRAGDAGAPRAVRGLERHVDVADAERDRRTQEQFDAVVEYLDHLATHLRTLRGQSCHLES